MHGWVVPAFGVPTIDLSSKLRPAETITLTSRRLSACSAAAGLAESVWKYSLDETRPYAGDTRRRRVGDPAPHDDGRRRVRPTDSTRLGSPLPRRPSRIFLSISRRSPLTDGETPAGRASSAASSWVPPSCSSCSCPGGLHPVAETGASASSPLPPCQEGRPVAFGFITPLSSVIACRPAGLPTVLSPGRNVLRWRSSGSRAASSSGVDSGEIDQRPARGDVQLLRAASAEILGMVGRVWWAACWHPIRVAWQEAMREPPALI